MNGVRHFFGHNPVWQLVLLVEAIKYFSRKPLKKSGYPDLNLCISYTQCCF